jgi:hypothetical protein
MDSTAMKKRKAKQPIRSNALAIIPLRMLPGIDAVEGKTIPVSEQEAN